jgi:hypothetical protein
MAAKGELVGEVDAVLKVAMEGLESFTGSWGSCWR